MSPHPGSFSGGFRGKDGYFDPPVEVVRVCEAMQAADDTAPNLPARIKREIREHELKRSRARRRILPEHER